MATPGRSLGISAEMRYDDDDDEGDNDDDDKSLNRRVGRGSNAKRREGERPLLLGIGAGEVNDSGDINGVKTVKKQKPIVATSQKQKKFQLFENLVNYFKDIKFKPTVYPDAAEAVGNGFPSTTSPSFDTSTSEKKKGETIGEKYEAKGLEYTNIVLNHPSRLTPIMVWNSPANIEYPTPLSSMQLNAVVFNRMGRDVEGTIVYNPVANTVLPVGAHALSALFIPTQINRYENVTMEVVINITKFQPEIVWETDIDEILFGIPLPNEMFCARCVNDGIRGTFEYSQSPGQMLQRGRIKVTCKFTPSDTDNYKFAYTHHFIQITACPATLVWPPLKKVVYGNKLRADFLMTAEVVERDAEGHFTYSPEDGVIYPAGLHIFTATFHPKNLNMYHTTRIKNTLEVLKCRPILEWKLPSSLFDGAPLTEASLCCKVVNVKSGGTFVYNPPLGTVLKIGISILNVTFYPNDSANYDSASAQQEQSIFKKVTPVIYWGEGSALIYPAYLSKVQLNATISGLVPGKLVYDPPIETMLTAGQHKLSVTFYPNDPGKTTASKSISIWVNKGQARLQWDTPLPILEGQPLGQSHLSAFCTNCEGGGTFTYTPVVGTVLNAGKHSLHCLFEPADRNNWIGGEISSSIVVKSRVKTRPDVTWNTPDRKFQYPYPLTRKELNASGSCYGEFRYDPPAGKVLPVGRHMLDATLIPLNPDSYTPASAQIFIEVIKGIPVLLWESFSLIYSQELQEQHFNCVLTVTPIVIEGTITYDHDLGHILPAGNHILKAFFEPKDKVNYYSAYCQIEVKVARAYPLIKWDQPASVIYPAYIDECLHLNTKVITPNIIPGKHPRPPRKKEEDDDTIVDKWGTPLKWTWQREIPDILWSPPPTSATTNNSTKGGGGVGGEAAFEPHLVGELKYSHESGEILDVGTYEISCRFYPKDIANFYSVDAAITFVVTPGLPLFTWIVPYNMTFGELLSNKELCANSSVESSYVYDPPFGTLLDVKDNHVLRCTITPTIDHNYRSLTINRSLNVKRRLPELTWTPPVSMVYGTPLSDKELCARICREKNDLFMVEELENEGSYTYSPDFGEILEVDTNVALTCLFKPTQAKMLRYTASTADATINVVKFQPTISWVFPLAFCQSNTSGSAGYPTIVYGDPLSSSEHLRAVIDRPIGCEIRGRFEYDPPEGTILPVGRKLLTVTWHPDDPNNVLSARYEFHLEIIKRHPKIIWNNPKPVYAGHPLSRKELCARLEFDDAEGILEYDPPLHTCLFHPGKYPLTVTYEPWGLHAKRSYHRAGPFSVEITVLPRKSSPERQLTKEHTTS